MFGGGQLNAGTVYCRIAVDNTGALGSLRTFNSALEQSERQASRSFGKMADQAGRAARTMTIIGVAGAAVTLQMVKVAASYQQTEKAMTTLLKSSDLAKAKLAELRNFALATPFQFTQLTEISRLMLAYKFSASELIPVLRDVGDAAAGLGGEPERLKRIVVALGQISAKGKLTADEMRQLTENGVSGWTYVAQAMGKTTAEVMDLSKKGLIPAKLAIDAIREGMRKDFGGMMADQAKTTAGQFSNLIDYTEKLATDIGSTLLPQVNNLLAGATKLAEGLNGLSDSNKAMIGSVMFGLPILALSTAAVLNMGRALFGATSVIGGFVLALRAKQAALATTTAEVSAYGVSVLAVANKQMLAATAAMDEALALEETFAATGMATEADLAFIAAEKEKARSMAMAAGAAQKEAATLTTGATASRAAFLGLSTTMWVVIGAIGAATAAWYLYKRAQEEPYRKLDEHIGQLKNQAIEKNAELTQLDAEKTKRQVQADQLKALNGEYTKLMNNSNRTAAEQGKLTSVKKQLADKMAVITKELYGQKKAWDGTAGSINGAIDALLDFTKIERKAFISREKLKNIEYRQETLSNRRERLKLEKEYADLQKDLDKSTAIASSSASTPEASSAMDMRANRIQKKLDELKPRLDAARAAENASYWAYRQSSELLGSIQNMTPEELDRLRKRGEAPPPSATPPPPKGTGGKTKGIKPADIPDPRELHRAYVQYRMDILSLMESNEALYRQLGLIEYAEGEHNKILLERVTIQKLLEEGIKKYGGEKGLSQLAIENKRTINQLLSATDEENAAARKAEEEALTAEMERQDARNEAETEQLQRLRDLRRAQEDLRAVTPADQLMLTLSREDAARREYAVLQLIARAAPNNLALQEKALQAENALLGVTQNRKRLEGELAQEREDANRKLLEDAQKRYQEEERMALARWQAEIEEMQRVWQAQERLADQRQRNADTVIEAQQRLRDLIEAGNRAAGLYTKDDEVALARKKLEEAQRRLRELEGTPLRLRGQDGATDVAIATQRAAVQEAQNALDAALRDMAEQAKEEFKLAGFGQALWDFNRDKTAIRKYFGDAVDEVARKNFEKAWAALTERKDGKPSQLEEAWRDLSHGLGLDKLAGKLPSWLKGDKLKSTAGAAAGIYSAYQSIASSGTTSQSEGMQQGALSGAMAGASFGPWGIAAGALLGGLFGGSSAEKRAREQANAIAREQLEQLRKLNNAIAPVSDYFSQGMFSNLPGTLLNGGGLARSYAVQTSRGAR